MIVILQYVEGFLSSRPVISCYMVPNSCAGLIVISLAQAEGLFPFTAALYRLLKQGLRVGLKR